MRDASCSPSMRGASSSPGMRGASSSPGMPGARSSGSEGPSVARHLARGAIGFGLLGSGLVLAARAGPAGLLLLPAGLVALRGCPTCWIAGLIEIISAGRLRRACADGGCTLETGASAKRVAATRPVSLSRARR